MEACGSGTGGVVTISNKIKQLFSPVCIFHRLGKLVVLFQLVGSSNDENFGFTISGSLDSEAGIYAMTYDVTGSRLITCEADKTIKMWKEDETATPETHPVHFKPPKDMRRF